jgi:hypothetical protein
MQKDFERQMETNLNLVIVRRLAIDWHSDFDLPRAIMIGLQMQKGFDLPMLMQMDLHSRLETEMRKGKHLHLDLLRQMGFD